MEINCIICSDLFTPNSEMTMNQCGHMFHTACLLQWLERSKTCPQCRTRATHKTTYKVYFNFINTEHISDDIGTLQAKLDSANFRVQLKERDFKELSAKYDAREAQNVALRELVAEVEQENGSLKSSMLNLKSHLSNYKSRAKECDRLENEIKTLKSQLHDMENVRTVINGTRNEVTEILRNETNVEALALLSATLKKTLLDAERKQSVIQTQLKHTQNDLMRYKKKCSVLEATCTELRKELENGKKSWDEEKEYLRGKISELTKMSESSDEKDTSIMRIMTESPAPLPRRKAELKNDKLVTKSPTVSETVINLTESDSPYLNVKTNYAPILDGNYSLKVTKKKSLFKTTAEAPKPRENLIYTGLGGQVKEDFYKFPTKKPEVGLKRPKSSSSSIPSNKFRKLAPIGTAKITEFLTID